MSASDGARAPDAAMGLAAPGPVAAFFLHEFVARILPSLDNDGIAADPGLANARSGTVGSVFSWVYAPMQLVVGALLDRYDARRPVIPACLTGTAAPMAVGARR